MRKFVASLLLIFYGTACTTTGSAPSGSGPVVTPLIAESKQFEREVLPPSPFDEPLPSDLPKGDWVTAIEKGETASEAGLVVSEERAWRDALIRLRYKDLRVAYEGDRKLIAVHREFYEDRFAKSEEARREALALAKANAERSFIERYGLELGLGGGLVIGVLTSIAILAAMEKIQE